MKVSSEALKLEDTPPQLSYLAVGALRDASTRSESQMEVQGTGRGHAPPKASVLREYSAGFYIVDRISLTNAAGQLCRMLHASSSSWAAVGIKISRWSYPCRPRERRKVGKAGGKKEIETDFRDSVTRNADAKVLPQGEGVGAIGEWIDMC